MRSLRWLVPIALVAVPFALARAGGPASAADAAAHRELDSSLRSYERWTRALAGDSIASMFAPDGEMLREDGSVLRGPGAVAGFLSGFKSVHVDSATLALEAEQVMGDDAVQWGTFAQVVRIDGQGTIHARGRFVWQWRRQPDGRWRLRRALTQSFPR